MTSSLAVVTGGAGFIGHHLVEALLRSGRTVRVVDDLSTGRLSRIPAGAEFLQGGVFAVAKDAMKGAEVVFHLACNPSVHFSVENPEVSRESVADTTFEVLEQAANHGVRKVVLASSCSIYGDLASPGPASPYAAAKLEAERFCHEFDSFGAVETSILRIFNAYGPGQHEAFVVPALIRAALCGTPMKVNGDGTQMRDFVHVFNVVDALLFAEVKYTPVPVDVGTGRSTSIVGLAEKIREMTGSNSSIEVAMGSLPAGESYSAHADVRELQKWIQRERMIPLTRGLELTIDAMKGNR